MEYLRGGLQAELKQETGPWTIVILKTSNIIIIWNLYQYKYPGKYPDINSCTRSYQKVLISGFQRSCIWSQWMKSTYWTKLYTGFAWGPHEPNWCQSSSKVFTFLETWKKGKLPEDQCIAACESMVYAYMYLGLFIYLWIWKNGWNFWKPSMLYNVHMWDILVWNNIQDPKVLGLPSN